ncbi:MAG TPA: hypothetical protein VE442_01150 [Jatrophihabitans sp.]|jgi:hypothetical protein|nr:hypothetical protein [Jatrophihabitans sp.]
MYSLITEQFAAARIRQLVDEAALAWQRRQARQPRRVNHRAVTARSGRPEAPRPQVDSPHAVGPDPINLDDFGLTPAGVGAATGDQAPVAS